MVPQNTLEKQTPSPPATHASPHRLAEQIAAQCQKATWHQDRYWQACCPAHEDSTPSLTITPAAEKVLLHCHAGCAVARIAAALGMTLADLYPATHGQTSTNGHRPIAQVYDYVDAHGTLVHQTVRYDTPKKGFSQRRPHPTKPGEYLWSLTGIEPVLYNLPAVLAAIASNETVYVVEGEKDANTLIALGLTATTNPMGAKKWRDSYTQTLTGAEVVLLPDNDDAGHKHAALVAQKLQGYVQALRLVQVPAPHKDVSDWMQAGGDLASLEALIAAPSPVVAPPVLDPPLPLSDYTNALAFVADHQADVRYCEAWKKWLIWDKTHWRHDTQAPVMQKAKATIKRLLRQTATLNDDKALAAWMAHIKRSLSTAALGALVTSAQNEPGIPVTLEALNQHPMLLPCANGTLDLDTGTLRTPYRADFLTECLRVAYDPTAACPLWLDFLWRIMGGSLPDTGPATLAELQARAEADTRARTLVGYLQRVLGQCLSGDVSEQDLYVFYGTGANGKSTLLNTVMTVLGRYAMKGTAEMLMVTRNDRHPTERADLFGKRLVATIETQQAGRLNETFIKEATGGDPIRARRMREDFWEFLPTHKIILATNHKPEIRGTDHAIWRRIKLVPFTVTIPEDQRDKTLPTKLLDELPGILAWMVQGCLDWKKDGLQTPEEVLLATAAYRKEQDVVEEFLASECFRTPTARCSAADLYAAYAQWCTQNDVDPLNKRAFGVALGAHDLTPTQGTGGRREWLGVGVPAKVPEDKRYGA